MSNFFDLSGRIVVVTGGLGQLGRQFAATLAAHGAKVVVLDRNLGTDYSLGGRIPAERQAKVMFVAADVTARASLEDALATVEARWGTPDGLVNNAAIDSPPDAPAGDNGPFETYSEASIDHLLDVNVKGTILCCQVFGGAMAAKSGGSIVNVGSIYGIVSPDQSIYQYRRDRGEVFFKPVGYSVSKSALYNLTKYLAVYWGKAKVRVNIVTFAGVFNNQDPNFIEAYLPKVPLGRMADESDYNGTIVYLLSEASRYMTGSNVVVDGGFTAM